MKLLFAQNTSGEGKHLHCVRTGHIKFAQNPLSEWAFALCAPRSYAHGPWFFFLSSHLVTCFCYTVAISVVFTPSFRLLFCIIFNHRCFLIVWSAQYLHTATVQ